MRFSKTYRYVAVLAAVLLLALPACNSDQEIKVSADIEEALYDRYPEQDIKSLEWRMDGEFFVAEFRMDGYHCTAWFAAGGFWYMTETTDIIYSDLPEEVKAAFDRDGHGRARESYKVDFADLETRYVIETKRGFFFYRTNGEQFKQVDGAWKNRPIVIDREILHYLDRRFELYTIVDADLSDAPLLLHVHEGGGHDDRHKAVYFDTPAMWLATVWSFNTDELPPVVLEAMRGAAAESLWSRVYRVEHRQVRSAYGLKLSDGECLFFDDRGEPLDIRDEILY